MLAWGDRRAGVCVMMVFTAGGGEHGRWWRVGSYPRNVRAGGRAAGWCGGGVGGGGGARTWALFVDCDKKNRLFLLVIPRCSLFGVGTWQWPRRRPPVKRAAHRLPTVAG